jgi:hypothetical protein
VGLNTDKKWRNFAHGLKPRPCSPFPTHAITTFVAAWGGTALLNVACLGSVELSELLAY